MSTARLSDQIKVDYVYDTDGTLAATAHTRLDMRDYDGCLFMIVGADTTIDSNNYIAAFKVQSNTASTGAGSSTTICKAVTTDGGTTTTLTGADMYGTTTATVAAAYHDRLLYLDVRADQMGAGHRYLNIVTTKGGTLPIVVIAIRYKGAHNFKDMLQTTRYAFQNDVR